MSDKILFQCDYNEGAHPKVLERLVQTNMEQTPGYSEDKYCEEARKKIRKACGDDSLAVHFLVGGTQTNVTVINAALRKHQGVLCGGIQLHILDETVLEPVAMGVRLLDLLRRMYPKDFAFLPPVREDGKIFLSLLAGHRDFEKPDWDADALLARYAEESARFRPRKAAYERYPKE